MDNWRAYERKMQVAEKRACIFWTTVGVGAVLVVLFALGLTVVVWLTPLPAHLAPLYPPFDWLCVFSGALFASTAVIGWTSLVLGFASALDYNPRAAYETVEP